MGNPSIEILPMRPQLQSFAWACGPPMGMKNATEAHALILNGVTECFSTALTTHFIVDRFLPIQVDLKGAKLCRVSVDYEPENTAKKELLGNSLGHGIVAENGIGEAAVLL